MAWGTPWTQQQGPPRIDLLPRKLVTVSVDQPSRSGGDVPPTVLSSRVFLPNVAASASEA